MHKGVYNAGSPEVVAMRTCMAAMQEAEGRFSYILPRFDCVTHFAGFKAVGESVEKPLEYYDNNFSGGLGVLT